MTRAVVTVVDVSRRGAFGSSRSCDSAVAVSSVSELSASTVAGSSFADSPAPQPTQQTARMRTGTQSVQTDLAQLDITPPLEEDSTVCSFSGKLITDDLHRFGFLAHLL